MKRDNRTPNYDEEPSKRGSELPTNPSSSPSPAYPHPLSELFSGFSNILLTQVARNYCLFQRTKSENCEKLDKLENKVVELQGDVPAMFANNDAKGLAEIFKEVAEIAEEAGETSVEIIKEAERNRLEENTEPWSPFVQDDTRPWVRREPTPLKRFEAADNRPIPEKETMLPTDRFLTYLLRDFEDEWGKIHKRFGDTEREWDQGTTDESRRPKVWRWSFRWPPRNGEDTTERDRASECSPSEEVRRYAHPHNRRWGLWYSPRVLEMDPDLRGAGVPWRDAFEDLLRAERGEPLLPIESIGRNSPPSLPFFRRDESYVPSCSPSTVGRYPRRVPWVGENSTEAETNEEVSYEYSHDHEDQHDDPLTPKPNQQQFTAGMPSTELDAYERLLDLASSPANSGNESRPSVLSTFTTTEQTILPDGTVRTKTVLRKRFSDGREERSESFHTHNKYGSEVNETQHLGQPQNSAQQEPGDEKAAASKKSGWFWST